jgi:hypothetical protein
MTLQGRGLAVMIAQSSVLQPQWLSMQGLSRDTQSKSHEANDTIGALTIICKVLCAGVTLDSWGPLGLALVWLCCMQVLTESGAGYSHRLQVFWHAGIAYSTACILCWNMSVC